jgi:hypothetical protein
MLALLLSASLAGCAPIRAWERGRFTKSHVAPDPHPASQALRDHVHASREAASGGGAAPSGGCGCY